MIPYKERKKIRVFTVVSQKTYKHLPITLKVIKRLGFTKINFFPSFQCEQWKRRDIIGFKNTVNHIKKNYKDILLNNETYENFDALRPKEIARDSYIMQNCDKLCVDFKGTFYPCERLLGFSEKEKRDWRFGKINSGVNLSLRKEMLKKLRCNLENLSPTIKLKKPYFCPFSFYFLSQQKIKKEKSINFCLAISRIYEKLFSK